MKQETNNEMDLLLRRLGRRQDFLAPAAGGHLDTDELSAYAENVLPVKTRARYTEHLAECSRCRELVVQLSASAGVVIAEQTDKISVVSGWRKFLAGLFSPMVLRYAAPALGLIVVAAIGFVVLRRGGSSERVSQVQPAESQSTRVAERIEPFQSPQNGAAYDDNKPAGSAVHADSAVNKEATKEAQTKDSEQSAASAPQPTPAPADVVSQNAPAAKAPEPKPEAQPVTVASEPPPPNRAKLDDISDKRQQNEDAVRKQEAEVKVAKSQDSKKNFEIDGAKGKDEGATPSTARSRVAKNKPVVGDLSSAQGAAAPGGARREREETGRGDKDSSAETRSVAGRRFRKQGGVWIDTAYDQSKAITTYHRDSESYRSLIADEPSIKTIADQLDGEIIVVWKGRTYRIQ